MKKNSTAKNPVSKLKADLGQTEIAKMQANAVMDFLTLGDCENASTPDFVTDAVIDAITEAGDIVGLPTPTYDDSEESEAERRQMLVDLFSQTKMLRLRDDKHKVLRALSELLHNPQVPGNLFEAVAQFVCEQSNQCSENLYHSEAVLTEVLSSVPPEDLRGATLKEANDASN